ncbi:acetyl-CoA acetyltransferase [Paenibacillus cymbidii]|uniref:acetyl-CoA acetyltransferase n=1 Tax=Paenibacillus cymbidii TaxID=1639034 RepID=UPI00108042C6|nr:acetyl-CoA acetyltransferase [Paenibacillus cymbidii]
MMNPNMGQTQVIYQADPAHLAAMQQLRDKMHGICGHHMHKPVMIQTADGLTHEGTIVAIEKEHLYLRVTQYPASNRFIPPFGFGPGGGDVILPLVLYNLLVISLL